MTQEEGRSDYRGHRDSRRNERPGHERSADRVERRPEERSSRSGPVERPGHAPEEERGSDRERGREKRGGDRESSRRDREREGERTPRDPERASREPRDPSRRSRDDGRTSGREERDRRSRGGGSGEGSVGDDGRKRVREPTDQGQGQQDAKRRR